MVSSPVPTTSRVTTSHDLNDPEMCSVHRIKPSLPSWQRRRGHGTNYPREELVIHVFVIHTWGDQFHKPNLVSPPLPLTSRSQFHHRGPQFTRCSTMQDMFLTLWPVLPSHNGKDMAEKKPRQVPDGQSPSVHSTFPCLHLCMLFVPPLIFQFLTFVLPINHNVFYISRLLVCNPRFNRSFRLGYCRYKWLHLYLMSISIRFPIRLSTVRASGYLWLYDRWTMYIRMRFRIRICCSARKVRIYPQHPNFSQ